MENINEKEELIENICSNYDKVKELEEEIKKITIDQKEHDLTTVLN